MNEAMAQMDKAQDKYSQSSQSHLTFLESASRELHVQRQRKRDPVTNLSKRFKCLLYKNKWGNAGTKHVAFLHSEAAFRNFLFLKFSWCTQIHFLGIDQKSILQQSISRLIQQKKNFGQIMFVFLNGFSQGFTPTKDFKNCKERQQGSFLTEG